MLPIFDGARGSEVNARTPRGMGGNRQHRPTLIGGDRCFEAPTCCYTDAANPATNFNGQAKAASLTAGYGNDKRAYWFFPGALELAVGDIAWFACLASVVDGSANAFASNAPSLDMYGRLRLITDLAGLDSTTLTWNNQGTLAIVDSFLSMGDILVGGDGLVTGDPAAVWTSLATLVSFRGFLALPFGALAGATVYGLCFENSLVATGGTILTNEITFSVSRFTSAGKAIIAAPNTGSL